MLNVVLIYLTVAWLASRIFRNRHHDREAGDLMVQLHVERTIAAPPDRVFVWLADPANLAAAPLVFKAGFAKSGSWDR